MSPDVDVRGRAPADPGTAAEALRERIYATITGLSTVVILLGYAEETSAWSAASSLAVTMLGLWAASFVADLVAHTRVHGEPARWELRRMAYIAGQILETAFLPVAVIAMAGTGIWTVRTGLIIAIVLLVITQTVAASWAVGRSTLGIGRRLLIIAVEVVLCGIVIAIKLLAH